MVALSCVLTILTKLTQDPAATTFVTNFTIIYIKMGYPRLSVEKQALLVPSVLASLEGKPASQQESLLLMIMPVLGEVVATSDQPQVWALNSTYIKDKFNI